MTFCRHGMLLSARWGWSYPFKVPSASGNPAVPGMGFRFYANQRWPYPNPTDSQA
jgi:hypothetical protein